MILALLAGAASAAGLSHEVGVGAGVGYQGGATVVAGGLGGDVRYRLGVGDHLGVHASVGPRVFLAPAVEIDLGVGWTFHLGERWKLAAGVEGAAMAGGAVRRLTLDHTEPLSGPPVAVRVFVDPIAYTADRFTVRALGLSGGVGVDALGQSLAIGVRLFEIGYRL